MAIVNLSESDFGVLMDAAYRARDARDTKGATALDIMARKLNAALTAAKYRGVRSFTAAPSARTWRDVPSVFIDEQSHNSVAEPARPATAAIAGAIRESKGHGR